MREASAVMNMDLLTIAVAFFSFVIFLIIHIITFRWVQPQHLLRSLLLCVMAMLGLPVVLMAILFLVKMIDAPLQAWFCGGLLASLLQGLLCFVYVLCIFGPYETSVRMRLVREIAKGATQGFSLQELLGLYNVETMVGIRLQRLTGSGDIIEKNGLYRIGRSQNFFFIFDAIARLIKRGIGR